jgi:hypothetical protein
VSKQRDDDSDDDDDDDDDDKVTLLQIISVYDPFSFIFPFHWVAQSVQWLICGLDDRGSIPCRSKNFFPHHIQTGSGAHSAYETGTGALSPEVKRLGGEAVPPLPIRLHGVVFS